MPELDPSDEELHQPGPDLFWNESYYLDYFDPSGSFGGYVRIGLYPNLGVVWYWGCVAGPDRPLVTVIDHAVPLPAPGPVMRLEHAGLVSEAEVVSPKEHMRIALDASAVRLGDPAEVYRGMRGESVDFGLRLDWLTDRASYRWPPFQDRYEIPCRVVGEITVDGETIELDGWGQRDHSWGVRDWWKSRWHWNAGRVSDGTRFHCAGAFAPGSDVGFGYILAADDDECRDISRVVAVPDLDEEGLFRSAHVEIDELSLDLEPLAMSPVLCVDPDGREARFPRGLARFTTAEGLTGLGWFEWNQPPASS